MRPPLGILACAVVGLGCRTCPRPAAPPPPAALAVAASPLSWSQVATDYGEIAIPVGWHVRASRSPDPVFDLYAGDRDLGVFAWPAQLDTFDASLDDAVRRYLRLIGSPPSLELLAQPEGWKYGEVAVAPGRVYAACAVEYKAERPAAFLATTATIYQLTGPRSVSKKLYEEAGGRAMLCGIAASARRLQLDR